MSLHSIDFPISQSTRLEYYKNGLRHEIYPHGYFLSELMKIVRPLSAKYSEDIVEIDNNNLDPFIEKAITNAKKFLKELNNPDIYRTIHFDNTTYEYELRKVPGYEKAIYIVKEALILRKLIHSIVFNEINASKQFINIQSAITEIYKFDEILNLFQSRLIEISIIPKLTPIERKLPVKNIKKEYEIGPDEYEKTKEVDEIIWQTTQKTNTLEIEFRYVVENFITIPWLELLHTIKNNYLVYQCPTCDNYYFHYLKKRKNCEICGYPSTKQTDAKKTRDAYKKKIERGMPRRQANKELEKLGLKPIQERVKKGGE